MSSDQARLAALGDLLVEAGVVTFGEFVTKSGRATPYFLDFGRIRTGRQVARLAGLYAARIDEEFSTDVDLLFGPAYKGIPLAVATAQALSELQDRDVGFCFDRKEAKDHGEGGMLVGQAPVDGDRVVIVEDVTTAGTSIRETLPKLRAVAPAVDVIGLVIAVDRAERAPGSERAALDVLAADFGLTATAVAGVDELLAFLHAERDVLTEDDLVRITAYRDEWGA